MKEYQCRQIEHELTVDGNLDKPEWQQAEWAALVNTVTGDPPKLQTKAKLLWSSRFLYAGFCCEDDHIEATMTGFNDKLYEEDVVELFITPDPVSKTYIEIEVNPLNALLHYFIANDGKGNVIGYARTEQTIQTAVGKDEKTGNWTAELAIPFRELVTAWHIPPQANDRWRFNLYRIDRRESAEPEYSAWSPTMKANFHVPDKFGQIVFIR